MNTAALYCALLKRNSAGAHPYGLIFPDGRKLYLQKYLVTMGWRELLYKAGSEAETHFDLLKLKFRQKMGLFGNVHIVTYMTYCNHKELFLRGRVLENRDTSHTDKDSLWNNLISAYRRFDSNEIADAKLRISFSNTTSEVYTDSDGYFEARISLNIPLPSEELWHHPVVELLEASVPFAPPVVSRCKVMTPPSTAQFGIISDIDDTILQTNAQSLIRSAYLTFLQNAHSRLPFEGVASFYAALQKGVTNASYNPLFYVSSSPWNLYDMLTDFMEINKIPAGPLFLKDIGFSAGKLFSEGHLAHKMKMITNILNAYPELPFILIGDSGQKDPEIYAQVVKDFPARIQCIYIRDVTTEERDIEVKKISEGLLQSKVEMVFAENSYDAAEHAASKGYIHPSSLEVIKLDKKMDKHVRPTMEELVDKEIPPTAGPSPDEDQFT
jgi:phosphatidate phosphatase APP1